MADENLEGVAAKSSTGRRWIVFIVALIVAFLLGSVPMWLSKRNVEQNFSNTKRELQRQHLQNSVASAAVYARRGEYETARQNVSVFFTDLQTEMNNSGSQTLSAQERSQIPGLLSARDEIITLLSRADPASAERLSNLYVDFRAATGGSQP